MFLLFLHRVEEEEVFNLPSCALLGSREMLSDLAHACDLPGWKVLSEDRQGWFANQEWDRASGMPNRTGTVRLRPPPSYWFIFLFTVLKCGELITLRKDHFSCWWGVSVSGVRVVRRSPCSETYVVSKLQDLIFLFLFSPPPPLSSPPPLFPPFAVSCLRQGILALPAKLPGQFREG